MAVRHAWIDAARGAALSLVVVLHAERAFDAAQVNPLISVPNGVLDGLRMPTLIALSGILATGVRTWAWADVWRRRVAPLLLMYGAWVVVSAVVAMAQGEGIAAQAHRLGLAYLRPQGTVWYLYALALYLALARVCARVPTFVMVPLSLGVFYAGREVIDWGGDFWSWAWIADHWVFFVCAERFARAYVRVAERATATRAVLALGGFVVVGATATAAGALSNPTMLLALCAAGTLVSLTCAGVWGTARWLAWARAIGRRSLGVYAAHMMVLTTVWTHTQPWPQFSGGGVALPLALAAAVLAISYAITVALSRWAPVPLLRPWWSTAARPAARDERTTPAQ